MIAEKERQMQDNKWTCLVTREEQMVHWNQYLNRHAQDEEAEDWEEAFL
jgi:hypothetical protein